MVLVDMLAGFMVGFCIVDLLSADPLLSLLTDGVIISAGLVIEVRSLFFVHD